ncbi:MAG: methylated-DNA--[protein]-cysteine S-methyltransferase [Bacilli bacterium]|nr:methylated-DNA--[protein]-cysteine S-methyltransferase [Bacilli bacterium]
MYICKFESIMGNITLASDGESLIGLWFDNQKYYLGNIKDDFINKDLPIFKETKKWLDIYFRGKEPNFKLSLNPMGSTFRKDVWDILLQIPYGKVITYGEISKRLEKKYGRKMSAQAVGGAVGHNPISIIIPCHRVVGSNGQLTGYAGGIDKKEKLLELEGVNIENLF